MFNINDQTTLLLLSPAWVRPLAVNREMDKGIFRFLDKIHEKSPHDHDIRNQENRPHSVLKSDFFEKGSKWKCAILFERALNTKSAAQVDIFMKYKLLGA